MQLRFRFDKALQAAGVLLRLEAGRMPSARLSKLLYIADREMLASAASPITGDRATAMKNGPVPTHVHALIAGVDPRSDDWNKHIRTEGDSMKLVADPGRGKLSKGEVDKLSEVSARYRDKDGPEFSELTRNFPEWRRSWPEGAEGGAYPISWEDILTAQGEGAETIRIIEEEEAVRDHIEALFEPDR